MAIDSTAPCQSACLLVPRANLVANHRSHFELGPGNDVSNLHDSSCSIGKLQKVALDDDRAD